MNLRTLVSSLIVITLASGCAGQVADHPATSTPSGANLAQACDAKVDSERIRAREVDLAVDPNNRQRLAAGYMVSIPSTRQSAPDDEPVWTRIVRSTDGGRTWRGADLSGWPGSPAAATSPFAGSAVIGDPVLTFLPDGTLLLVGIMIQADYNYAMFSARFVGDGLQPSDVVVYSRGAYGDPRLNPVPSPGSVLYNDKEEVTADWATGTLYISWMWRTNNPTQGVQSIPVVVMSKDGGKSWSDPKTLSGGLGGGFSAQDGNIGETPVTTTDGRAHIVWFVEHAKTLVIASAPTGTVDFGSPRVIATNVVLSSQAHAIAIVLPSVAVGASPNGTGESVYVAWADSRNGDADILLIRSDDHGATWSEPMRVNGEPVGDKTDQLVPVVAASPSGLVGVHYVAFSASRDEYNAYAAVSSDGGRSFNHTRISNVTTQIAKATGQRATGIQAHIGDYFGAAFTGDAFVSMWQDGRDGSTDKQFTAAYACRLPVTSTRA